MNFWNILKYVFFIVFFLIMVVAFSATIEDNAKETQQIVTPQSKFNF